MLHIWSDNGKYFIAEWKAAASSSFAIGYGGTSLKRRIYEALCAKRKVWSTASPYEAKRCKRETQTILPKGENFTSEQSERLHKRLKGATSSAVAEAMAGQASKASGLWWRCPAFITLRRGKEEKLCFWVKSFYFHKSVKWSLAASLTIFLQKNGRGGGDRTRDFLLPKQTR